MTKKQKPEATKIPPAIPPAPQLVTFSVRLTEREHQLVQDAAQLEGWTATSLVRKATLERATHIINTRRVTTFNFASLASELAKRLFEPRTVKRTLDQDELLELHALLEHQLPTVVDAEVEPLPLDVAVRLKKAALLGGTEFLKMLVAFADGATGASGERDEVPDPIDPSRY